MNAATPQRPVAPRYPWAKDFLTIGTTGTNGKTSTTHMLVAAFQNCGVPVVTENTLGYFYDGENLGLPNLLTSTFESFRIAHERGGKTAVIEITSQALARGDAQQWRFDTAIFTNLSPDHLDVHGSFENYLAAKAQLFMHLGPGRPAILNVCDETAFFLDKVIPPDVRRVWYGCQSRGNPLGKADLFGTRTQVSRRGTTVTLQDSPLAAGFEGELSTPLVGQVFGENLLAAACALLEAGLTPEQVKTGLASCPSVPGRFEIVAQEPLAVVDYAHTPDALARTCDAARGLVAGGGKLIVVFGAGGARDATKRPQMGKAVAKRADVAIITTDNPRNEPPEVIAKAVMAGAREAKAARVVDKPDRAAAIAYAVGQSRPGDVVVVAGKGHEQGQIIGDKRLPFCDKTELTAAIAKLAQ